MSDPSTANLTASLEKSGLLRLCGPGLAELVGAARIAELWYSQPDQGLAVHFLTEAKPGAIKVQTQPGDPPAATMDVSEFLTRTGLWNLAGAALKVGLVDQNRRVVALTAAAAGASRVGSVLDDYPALEDDLK